YIGGEGLARSYVKRPDVTAERFVPNPFAPEGGERLYRTGDICRWRVEGVIEYVGRTDYQVKVRGFRIELGEVEASIRRAGAQDVVAMARNGVLIAYIVGVKADEVRATLKTSLPEYMIPALLVEMESLPLNANGKIDRRALPEPNAAESVAFVAPRTATEEMLAGIWCGIL